MDFRKFSLAFGLLCISLFVRQSHGLCMPCPRENMALADYTECSCTMGLFHDKTRNLCVEWSKCPAYNPPTPTLASLGLDQYKDVLPMVADTFQNSVNSIKNQNWDMPKDYHLAKNAFGNRVEEIRKNLPGLLGPIVGPIVIKNKDIVQECQGKVLCVTRKALEKQENWGLIFPKLKPVLMAVMQQFLLGFEDLEHMSKKEECHGYNCPIVKGVVSMKNFLPRTFGDMGNMQDFAKIGTHLTKYVFGDLQKYLAFLQPQAQFNKK